MSLASMYGRDVRCRSLRAYRMAASWLNRRSPASSAAAPGPVSRGRTSSYPSSAGGGTELTDSVDFSEEVLPNLSEGVRGFGTSMDFSEEVLDNLFVEERVIGNCGLGEWRKDPPELERTNTCFGRGVGSCGRGGGGAETTVEASQCAGLYGRGTPPPAGCTAGTHP
eukprot:CAMPEP_0194327520 /NCGR_PEP_ID=MMETSP0171-20130528/41431_1 /TAXON_ID=218684 /ORGANISM="Corethron pennatum, Strain L29A3" /LENGTH=166 /DNA_ID=CAMNT_0039087497 /DNA_START=42 /DNA_END=542 /DNA_ORIENTATION=-